MNYYLYDNKLTKNNKEDRLARLESVKMNTREDLIKKITIPGSILKPTEIIAVIDSYWEVIRDFISKGEGYSDEYISTRFNVKGTFRNDKDEFDSSRHALIVDAILKARVAEATQQVKMKKLAAKVVAPEIDGVYDWGTKSKEGLLTPGDVLEVVGDRLKIYDNLNEEGVFFVNQLDGKETQVVQLRVNQKKTLTFRVPELKTGNYRLEIRNTHHSGRSLRIGYYSSTLTVT